MISQSAELLQRINKLGDDSNGDQEGRVCVVETLRHKPGVRGVDMEVLG